MGLFYLPVEILLHVGSYLSREDQISLATTCKGIRKAFMLQIFGGTVYIRSPLPLFPNIFNIFGFLRRGMSGLQKCTDQVAFYRDQSDLARSVHTVQMTNWTVPSPQRYLSTASELAEDEPECQSLLEEFQRDQYYPNALRQFRSVYDSIVVNLVQCLPFSELRLIRTLITQDMHHTLHRITLQRLVLEDCHFEAVDLSAHVGIGRYQSFKATSGELDHLPWTKYLPWNNSDPDKRGIFIRNYLFWGCLAITKLEICIEFLRDDVLEVLSLPSLASLAIVPHAHIICEMWSWRTVYLILKISPNITCFRFEPLHRPPKELWPFTGGGDWDQYKHDISNLPLSQLSSITAYRDLVACLVPGRPVNFIKILLFPDVVDTEVNWYVIESDDECDGIGKGPGWAYMVPYQLARSATLIRTLYLQCIDEQQELKNGVLCGPDIKFLHDACPYLTDLWIPGLMLRSSRDHYRDPAVVLEGMLAKFRILDELERCTVGSCSPWVAKELEWYREGTILHERMHPTLEELLLGVNVLWKWQDDTEVTGWVLYISTDIAGSEDSEEAIYPPDLFSDDSDSVCSDEQNVDLEFESCIEHYEFCQF